MVAHPQVQSLAAAHGIGLAAQVHLHCGTVGLAAAPTVGQRRSNQALPLKFRHGK